MNATELAKLTIKELKAIAQAKGIEVAGDKRSKATWVLAIESWQIDRVEIETTPEVNVPAVDVPDYQPIDSPFELVIKSDPIDSPPPALEPNTQALEPNPQVSEQTAPLPLPMRGASIVAIVAVLIFGVAFLVIKTGLTSISWVVSGLSPLALGLWRYLVPEAKHQDSTGSRSSIPLNQVLIN
jgi:hypothetical protein